ncbi:MAG: SpoIIE family protein phosphatase, partial [Planctomycetes bacterium]|nr:SpoIIE family protein phosphatase [Planctomycetota bacterium]
EIGGEGRKFGERGVLYVDSRAATREFTDADLALFHALAQHIAIAIENKELGQQAVDRARLQRSLEIAEEIQQGLMPASAPGVEGFVAYGWFRAAEHAAGDFFDFVSTQAGSLAAVVGDVSGHGIGPALITATAQAGLRAYLRLNADPGQVLSLLNQDLSERMEVGMFLTLALAVLGRDGNLQVVNAGHPPPFLWRRATETIECLRDHEVAVGLIEGHAYTVTSALRMEPGDILLVYSDGLVEARHPLHTDRLFGEEGLRAVLADVGHRGGSAQDLVSELSRNVLEFCEGSREDDMTLVAIGLPA